MNKIVNVAIPKALFQKIKAYGIKQHRKSVRAQIAADLTELYEARNAKNNG